MSSSLTFRRVGRPVYRLISCGLCSVSLTLMVFCVSRTATADDTTSFYNFNGASSTDWMDGTNWTNVVTGTTGTLPGAGSTADIAAGLTTNVGTVANPTPTINIEQLYIGQDGDSHGPATFPNPTPPPATIQWPAPAVGNGELDQNAGTINVGVVDPANTTSNNGWVKLGAIGGTTGTYKMSGTAALNLNNDFLSVGEHGTGVLSMTDTAAVTTTGFTAGRWGDGHGTVTIGGTATLTSSGDMRVGDQGTGTLTQSGGTVNATGGSWVDIGRETGSHGTYTMTGGTLNLGTTAANHNADMNVGNDGNGVFAQSGTSSVSQVNGWIFIARQANTGGDNNGSTLAPGSGTYTLSDTASLTTAGRIYVGGSGGAIPTFGAPTGTLTVGTKAGDNPTVSAGDEIHVGDGGIGTLTQNSGSVTITSGSWLKIGRAGGTGTYNMNNGTLTIGDTIMIGGDGSNGTGTMNISGGTITSAAVRLGQNGGGTNHGTVNQTGGSVTTTDVRVGWDNTNTGTYSISAGTLTDSGDFHVAGAGGAGSGGATGTFNLSGTGNVTVGGAMFMGDGGAATMNVSGGTLAVTGRFNMAGGQSPVVNQTGGSIQVGQDLNVGDNNGTIGTYNISGGTLTPGMSGSGAGGGVGGVGGALDIGWNNTGTFNQTGGLVDLSSASAHGLQFNGNGGGAGNGTYNLSGGTLLTPIVFKSAGGASTATFNFNGGTLKAAAADNTYATGDHFMGNLSAANVQAGGALIDTNSFAITISQNLLHDPGIPVTTADGGLRVQDSVGGGSLTLTGNNTFNGLTNAISGTLNVNSANALGGSTLNLVPANAGTVNFGAGVGAFTLGGIQGSNNLSLQDTGATNFALTVGGNGFSTIYTGVLSNGSGVTKVGGGTLALSAAQTYGGPTAVNGGTLLLTSTASLPASSAVTVGGASGATIAGTGTIGGTLRINGITGGVVGHVAPGINTPGSNFGGIGTLTSGALTLTNGSVLDFDFGAPGTSDLIASTGSLTLPTSGSVVLNLNNTGGFGVGTYKLITESSTSNFSATGFSVGTNIVGFQEAFSNPGGTEVDMIVTPAPTWKAVAVSNAWEDPANWDNGVPGSTSGVSSDIASFAHNSNFLNPTPDLNRHVAGITFDSAGIGVYVIGSTGGNALLLTAGGTIQTTSSVSNTETINAPLVIQGTDSTYTFLSNASDNTKSLVFGGSVSATGGNTVLTLTGSNTSNNAVNGVISNGTATSLSLTKNGTGTWVLGGNNTFSGGVTLNSGTLVVGNNNALGSATMTANAGALQASTGGPFNVGNSINIAGALTVSGANDFTLSGQISGAGALTAAGSNTVTLTHNNTYTGGVSLNSGTLRVGNNGALGTGTLTAGGGALSTDANGPYTVSNAINLASTMGVSGASDLTLSGAISGSGGLNKTGTNTLTLTNANSFSGGLTINAGKVNAGPAVPSNTTLGTGTVTLTGTSPTLNLLGYQSSGKGLLAQFYNNAPANVGNQDPAYNALTTMNAQLNALTPAVSTSTVVGGKTDLNFTSGGSLATDPVTGGFTGGGNRDYIFNKVGTSTALYGFPPVNVGTVGEDNFQVRFSGFINITHPDSYTFTTTSDDGSVLFIDGGDGVTPNDDIPLVNNNQYQGMTLKSGSVTLTAGLHAITVGYYEGGGGLGLGVTYADQSTMGDTGGLMMAIPNSVLSYSGFSSSSQTYANNVVVTADSTINIANSLTVAMGALSLGANTLNVASSDATATPYSLTFNGATTLTGNGTINVANSTGGGTGRVNLSTIGGAFSLTKTGPGVLSISGTGTYSGGTVASGGTVIANGPGSIGTGPVTFNNTSTLRAVGVGNGGFVPVIPNLDNTAATWTVNGTAAGFANSGFTGTGNATTLQLTDSMNNEQSSAWFNTKQTINNSLQVKFTYQMTGGGGNPADGAAFVIQNDAAGTAAIGGGGGNLGYVGINNSAAFEINVYNGHQIGTAFLAGSAGPYNAVGAVNLVGDGTTGDVINVSLVYNAIAGTITQTLNDTTNNTSFTSVLPLGNNTIAGIIGSDTALIGFTGATGGANSTHTISNFEFDSATSSIYTNNVVVNGGSNATIDVGTTGAINTVAMGSLTVNSGAGTTLNLTATTAPANSNYELDFTSGIFNGNVGVNIASNGTGTGTMRVGGPSTFANSVAVNFNSGKVVLTNSGAAATVGTGVSVTVASPATLVLAGTTSNLSNPTAAANRVHVINNSTQAGGGGLNVTGTNQQTGAIDGTGDTVVAAGGSLTANHIIQNALVISGTATSLGTATIAASDASGNPLASGLAIAGSLGGGSSVAVAGSGSPVSGSIGTTGSLGGSGSRLSSGGGTAAVPEPSSILLVVLGGLACLAPVVRRKARKA